VLLNQCPHNLDLYQWFFGMPDRVTGFASLGKYHKIEVEDEVTAYLEHGSGMVGHFITSTGELPGSNRLEIAGENGKLVFENGEIVFHRNRKSALEVIRTATGGFEKTENTLEKIPFEHHGEAGHGLVMEGFVRSIKHGDPLIAPAAEGLGSILLANAALFSGLHGSRPVALPMDEDAYAAMLEKLAAGGAHVL
jgi:predicted dehydrogenase